MTDSNTTEHSTSSKAEGADSLEEAAQEGPLPGSEHIDEAAKTGRDNSEAGDAGENTETDSVAGGVILGGISQSR